MGYFKGHKKVTKQQYQTLRQGGSIIVGGKTVTYDEDTMYIVDDTDVPMLKVTQAQYQELLEGKTVTIDGVDYTYDENTSYVTDETDTIPTKVSELENDVGYLTSSTEKKLYRHDICFNFIGDITINSLGTTYSITNGVVYLTVYSTSSAKLGIRSIGLSAVPIQASGYAMGILNTPNFQISGLQSDAADTFKIVVSFYKDKFIVEASSAISMANISPFVDMVTEV